MTLPSSGPLSMLDINTEFGRGYDLNSYRGTVWYTDAGGSGTFPITPISISDFYEKRATPPITYVNPLGFNGGTYYEEDNKIVPNLAYAAIYLTVYANGTWGISGSLTGSFASGNWVTPTTAGIGTGKYVRFTLDSTSGSSTDTTWATTTGWLEISATREIYISSFAPAGAQRFRYATYTVQIATDSGGSNIVTSGTATLQTNAISEY